MSDERQRVIDEEHLRLLALFHYISGGMTIAFASMFGMWLAIMSVAFSMVPMQAAAECVADAEDCVPGAEALEWLPGIFLAVFGIFILLFLAFGVLEVLAGWFISKHRRRMFAIVVAIPGLLFIPYGTLLSLFTILVLERTSVKALFGEVPRARQA